MALLCFNLSYSKEKQTKVVTPQESGKSFAFVFMQNYRLFENNPEQDTAAIFLLITSEFDTKVKVFSEDKKINLTANVKKGLVTKLALPKLRQFLTFDTATKAALYLESEKDVTVYGLTTLDQTSEMFKILPTSYLYKDYVVSSYRNAMGLSSQFAVVALEDSTRITVFTTTPTTNNMSANHPYDITLNKGEVYVIRASVVDSPFFDKGPSEDLTGSYINSNKTIAVFAGHQCAYVPTDVIACNHLIEQMIPIKMLGNEYLVGNFNPRISSAFRIIATDYQTEVKINKRYTTELNYSKNFEDKVLDPINIETSKPVSVMEYSQGYNRDGRIGDPMMVTIRPVNMFQKKYQAIVPELENWDHYINLYVETGSIKSLKLNGKSVDPKLFSKIADSKYSFAYIKTEPGVKTLECSSPFSISIYGFSKVKDQYDAYGTM